MATRPSVDHLTQTKTNLDAVYRYKEPPHLNFLHFQDECGKFRYNKWLNIHVLEGLRSLEEGGWAGPRLAA